MLETRPEWLARARVHLSRAQEIGEDIRSLRASMPTNKRARLEQMKKIAYMQTVRISSLELAASYLYKEE